MNPNSVFYIKHPTSSLSYHNLVENNLFSLLDSVFHFRDDSLFYFKDNAFVFIYHDTRNWVYMSFTHNRIGVG